MALEKACNPRMYKKFDDVAPGDYPVVAFKHTQTRYGLELVVVTEDFMVFLPDRFLEKIPDAEQLALANSERFIMQYSGKDAARKNFLKLKFIRVDVAPLTADEWQGFLANPSDIIL